MGQLPIQIMKLRYAGPRRNVGFTFSPIRNNEPVAGFRHVFLYEIDAEFVLAPIRSNYPLTNPESGERAESFDPCWDNPIPKAAWIAILDELDALRPNDEPEASFRAEFRTWLRQALDVGDHVTVSGNL